MPQFHRWVNLMVTQQAQAGNDFVRGLDLSQMRFTFDIQQADIQTPNTAIIRVYNLADETAQSINEEYALVILQAGYTDGNKGVIFQGTIRQIRRGRETPTDTYLDILAADGDREYSTFVVNAALAAGATPEDELKAIGSSLLGHVDDISNPTATTRGQVQFGMAAMKMRRWARGNDMIWSFQNGKIQAMRITSYLPGEAVVITRDTGMIGLPEQTQGGIMVKTLINPKLRIGGLLRIDNASIQRGLVTNNTLLRGGPGRIDLDPIVKGMPPRLSEDGTYRIYAINYRGDTRGDEWYCDITCLAVQPTGSGLKGL